VRTRSLAAPLPARKEAAPFAAGEAETRTLQKQQRAVESLRDASPAGAARLSAQPPAPGVAEARHLADRPPEEWLAAIRQLRASGQTQAADELLARFRERFPAYPLPAGF